MTRVSDVANHGETSSLRYCPDVGRLHIKLAGTRLETEDQRRQRQPMAAVSCSARPGRSFRPFLGVGMAVSVARLCVW